MHDTVLYCTNTTPILYWRCIICPSSFCKYVQCNFFNNIFIFLRTILIHPNLDTVRKSMNVSHSLTVPRVCLPNPLQTTFTSITLSIEIHFTLLLMQSLHVLITYWIRASKPFTDAPGLYGRLLNQSYSILQKSLIYFPLKIVIKIKN